jgi:hypothetical protein
VDGMPHRHRSGISCRSQRWLMFSELPDALRRRRTPPVDPVEPVVAASAPTPTIVVNVPEIVIPPIVVNVPEQPAPMVTVNVPPLEMPQIRVDAPQVNVEVAAPEPAIVNVAPPAVTVEAAVVNVPAPVVNVEPVLQTPDVHVDVAAPEVTVAPNIVIPKEDKRRVMRVLRDDAGRISGSEEVP